MSNHIANKRKSNKSLSYVELRNQKRNEQIRMIRALLVPGDQMKVSERCEKSIRSVNDTLNESHPLFSKPVIAACFELLQEAGRIEVIPQIAE